MHVLNVLLVLMMALPGMQHLLSTEAASADKIQYEEFVAVDDLGRDALLRNAMSFMDRVHQVSDRSAKAEVAYSEGIVRKQGSFYVYKKGLLTPQIHGEIKYTLQLAVDETGYTYTYNDFVFQYYEKNRWGRYLPVSGKKKSLDEEKFAGMQDLWEQHKATARQHIQGHIRALKTHMQVIPPGAGVYDHHEFEEKN